jgi:uncharacterized lipoprotein
VKFNLLGLSISIFVMTGCAVFSDDEKGFEEDYVYTKAKQTKSLKIPAGLVIEEDDFAPVPALDENASKVIGKRIDNKTPSLILAVGNDLRVNHDADTAAVWINATKEDISQRIKSYVRDNKMSFVEKDSVIITGWQNRVDDSFFGGKVLPKNMAKEKNRYSFHLFPSKLPNEIGVQVVQVESLGVFRDDEAQDWKVLPFSAHKAIEFLNEFIIYDYEKKLIAAQEALTLDVSIDLRVAKGGDDSYVLLAADTFSNTWNKFIRVAEEAGFEVEENDATIGLLSVEYDNPETSIISSKTAGETATKIPDGDYSIQFSEIGEHTTIQLFNSDGQPLNQAQLTQLYYVLEPLFARK